MNCLECQDLLQRRLDGEPVADRAALQAHLASCRECRERHAAVQPLQEALRALAPPVPPLDLTDRTTARVLRDLAGVRFRRRLTAALALAAALLLAVFGGSLWLGGSRQRVVVEVIPVPPAPQDGESLQATLGKARAALAGLAERVGAEVKGPMQVLQASPGHFVSTGSLPQLSLVTQPLDSTGDAVRRSGEGVSTGLQPVSRSARRAFNFFLRKLPPLPPARGG